MIKVILFHVEGLKSGLRVHILQVLVPGHRGLFRSIEVYPDKTPSINFEMDTEERVF
jgi:hypothetical protein